MLRIKALQNIMKQKFQIPAQQDYYIDINVKEWIDSLGLPFGKAGTLLDLTKQYVWKIAGMSDFEIENMHQNFLSKGFTEDQYSEWLINIEAKATEIVTLYSFCHRETSKMFLRVDVSLPIGVEMIEGNYSSWVIYDGFDDLEIDYYDTNAVWVNSLETKAILICVGTPSTMKLYDIETKTVGESTIISPWQFYGSAVLAWRFIGTFLNTYLAIIEVTTGDVLIYKNGLLLQRFTLIELGLDVPTYRTISFSPLGKYIFITGKRLATGNKGWIVLKGN
jgi:hypothetical protein